MVRHLDIKLMTGQKGLSSRMSTCYSSAFTVQMWTTSPGRCIRSKHEKHRLQIWTVQEYTDNCACAAPAMNQVKRTVLSIMCMSKLTAYSEHNINSIDWLTVIPASVLEFMQVYYFLYS